MSRLIVLDTNVLISAAISDRGPPNAIVSLALQREILLLSCPAIVDEYYEVFRRPKFKKLGFPPFWLSVLLQQALHRPQDPDPWPIAGPDPDDLVFLALAKGNILVTGNIKDFPKSIRLEVQVVTPAEYLKIL